MALVDATNAGALIPTLWENKVQYAANNRRGLTRMITDTGSRWFGAGGTIKWPVIQQWPAALAYSGGVLTGQVFGNAIGSSDITPTWIYTSGIFPENVLQSAIGDIIQITSAPMAKSLYQKVDIDIATLFGSAVQTVGGAVEWSEGDFLSGISKLLTNAGDKVEMGQIYGAYHTNKWDAIFATGNIVSAAVRGESNSGAKTGMVEMAYGVKLFFTANIQNSPLSNALFIKDSIWMARKNRPKIELERNVTGNASTTAGLSTSVACSTGYGMAYLHKSTTPQFTSDLIVEHNTTTT